MVVWLFRLYGCFLLGNNGHKVRFTLGSGGVESGESPVVSALRACSDEVGRNTQYANAQLLGRSAGTVPAGRQMLPSGKRRLVYPNYDSDYMYYNPLDEMFSGLRSGAGQSIMSAVVPAVQVDDPVVQKMVDEVSGVLRGVDEKSFLRFDFLDYKIEGNEYFLVYDAVGKHRGGKLFQLYVILGTNGQVSGVMVQSKGGVRDGPSKLPSSDSLREYLERIGSLMSGRRK